MAANGDRWSHIKCIDSEASSRSQFMNILNRSCILYWLLIICCIPSTRFLVLYWYTNVQFGTTAQLLNRSMPWKFTCNFNRYMTSLGYYKTYALYLSIVWPYANEFFSDLLNYFRSFLYSLPPILNRGINNRPIIIILFSSTQLWQNINKHKCRQKNNCATVHDRAIDTKKKKRTMKQKPQ